jgi:hypothetical protein
VLRDDLKTELGSLASAIPVGVLSRPIRSVNVFILVHVGVLPRFEERAPAVWRTGDRSPSGITFLGHIVKCARILRPVSLEPHPKRISSAIRAVVLRKVNLLAAAQTDRNVSGTSSTARVIELPMFGRRVLQLFHFTAGLEAKAAFSSRWRGPRINRRGAPRTQVAGRLLLIDRLISGSSIAASATFRRTRWPLFYGVH